MPTAADKDGALAKKGQPVFADAGPSASGGQCRECSLRGVVIPGLLFCRSRAPALIVPPLRHCGRGAEAASARQDTAIPCCLSSGRESCCDGGREVRTRTIYGHSGHSRTMHMAQVVEIWRALRDDFRTFSASLVVSEIRQFDLSSLL